MKKLKYLLLILILFSIPISSQTTINLATGAESGVYYAVGVGLKAAIEKACPDITIALKRTAGAIDNAWLLSNNEVQLALVQSDIAGSFRAGERMFRYPSENMMALATLYPEVIHLAVRKDSKINSILDLEGKKVNLGEQNSGTIFNAEDILIHLNLLENCEKFYLNPAEVKTAFENKKLDAAFLTSGVPSDIINNFADEINLLSLDSLTTKSLIEKYSYFQHNIIPSKSYSGQQEELKTISVDVVLTARKDLDLRLIRRITEAIFKNKSELIKSHVVAKNINLENSYKTNTLQLHPGAEEFYKDSARIERAFSDYLLDGLAYLFFSIIIIYSIYNHKKFRYNFTRNQYFQIAVLLGTFFTIGTFGTYWFEKSVNKNFDNIIDSFWTTIIYLLSGFEGNNPITVGGKISSIFILLGSVALLGSVIGHFTSIFIRESKKKMPVDLTKHIAVCYWSKRGDKIVKELRSSELAAEKPIIILHDNETNEKELRSKNNYYKNVFFIEGEPTNTDALSDSRVPYAESVIILAGEQHADSDPLTILTCLSIEKLCKRLKVPKPHIIAELMNRDNREIALEAGADEIVSAGFYRTGIMLQSALYPQLSDIFHELLSYGENKTSVYIIKEDRFSTVLYGKTFPELVDILNNNRDSKNSIILMGIKRNGKVIINPLQTTDTNSPKYFDVLKEGDCLAVLGHSYPDLTDIKL